MEKFEPHKGRYGYRCVNRELRRGGIAVNEKRAKCHANARDPGQGRYEKALAG